MALPGKKRDGRIFKKTLGSRAISSIIEARQRARGFNAIIERGSNPSELIAQKAIAEAEERDRLAMTVRSAWDIYISTLERERSRAPKTLEMKRCRFRKDILPAIGDKPLSDVEHDDLGSTISRLLWSAVAFDLA